MKNEHIDHILKRFATEAQPAQKKRRLLEIDDDGPDSELINDLSTGTSKYRVYKKGPHNIVHTDNKITTYLGDGSEKDSMGDTPAVIYLTPAPDGRIQEWYRNGKKSRDNDLPAVVYKDGTKEWWWMGYLHREEGPAIERPDGTKEYYSWGKRHNATGPAVEKPKQEPEYWRSDKKQYDIKRENGEIRFYLAGTDMLHREDGPAVVTQSGTERWYDYGRLTKDKKTNGTILEYKKDGLTYETNPDGLFRIYRYINGDKIFHSPDENTPAIITASGDKAWYKDGIRHRDSNKPAIERDNGIKEWYVDGKLTKIENPDGTIEEFEEGLKKIVEKDTGVVKYKNSKNEIHRDNGPAFIKSNPKVEVYMQYGAKHRDGGPAAITDTEQRWYRNDLLHRTDGPAIVNTRTGQEKYYINNIELSKQHFDFVTQKYKMLLDRAESIYAKYTPSNSKEFKAKATDYNAIIGFLPIGG